MKKLASYKKVFQLTHEKGYKGFRNYIIESASFYKSFAYSKEGIDLLVYEELCFIQKWLRDKHTIDIFFDVEGVTKRKYKYVLMDKPEADQLFHYPEELFNNSEDAFLEAVNAALKLINPTNEKVKI